MNNYSKELMHHGVQGMRWGIRRYQPYGIGYDPQNVGKFIGNMKRTPKGYQKALNRLSKDAEYNQAFGQEHDKKQEKYTKRSNEYAEKAKTYRRSADTAQLYGTYDRRTGKKVAPELLRDAQKFEKKSMKYAQKALEERKKRDTYNQLVKESDEMVNKIIADAAIHNFDITQKMDRKLVDTGNRALRVLSSVLLGPIPGTMATFRSQEVDSNRYKVTKNMDPSRNVGNLTYMITPERVLENNNRPYGIGYSAKNEGKFIGKQIKKKQIINKNTKKGTWNNESNAKYVNENGLSKEWKDTKHGDYSYREKAVKDKDGYYTTFIIDKHDPDSERSMRTLEKNFEEIKRTAPRYYVEHNYDWLIEANPELKKKSKNEIANMFKVAVISSNGEASLEGSKESGFQWAIPYVTFNTNTKDGKVRPMYTGTDD